MIQHRLREGAKRFLLPLLILLLLWLTYLTVDIAAFSAVRSTAPADAAIVLGASVWRDQPSPVFRERIHHGIDLYHAGTIQALIFTGGRSQGDRLAEAEAARELALEAGVPAEAIYIETASRTTWENLLEARSVVVEQGFRRVLVVSDPLHMRRAITMAEDLGLQAAPSPTPSSRYRSLFSQARFLFREAPFYAAYLIAKPFRIMVG